MSARGDIVDHKFVGTRTSSELAFAISAIKQIRAVSAIK